MGRMIQFETGEFGIAGTVFETEQQVRYAPGRGGGIQLRLHGEEVTTSREYLQEGGLVVWMGNEDLELVRGSADVRRHYLDFICGQVDLRYRRSLSRYKRALKARNLLLKERVLARDQIVAYTKILVEEGEMVQSVRHSVVQGLAGAARHGQKEISGRDEQLNLEYMPSGSQMLAEAYEQVWENEVRQRQTIVGPHRDDLKLSINGMAAADYASEGQQRTAALALKLAQGELLQLMHGRMPIYLLDDVFGELDAARRNALMKLLPAKAQKLITTTSVDWLENENCWTFFDVKDAVVTRRV